MKFPRHGCAAVAAFVLTFASANVCAQSYPTKPVRILIGYPPGGPTEVIGRVLADHLTQAMGQSFYVEGKPGAAGGLAGEVLVNSAPDGYTLNIVGLGVIATNHVLYDKMSYDSLRDFAPITLLVRLPVILEVSSKIPPASYRDFIAYAKAQDGKLNHGSPGIGTLPHLAAELLKMREGFMSEHVPYRGTGPFAQGMMQGELQWSFDVPNTAITLTRSGAVRVLAVAAKTRHPSFPDVATLGELGVADAEWDTWFGLAAPRATPKDIIDKLHAEIERGWKRPEVAQRLRNAGLEPSTTNPEETAKIFAASRERWSAVVKANNIKAE